MLDILILQKNIQKGLEKLIKNLLSILLIQKKLQKKIKSLLVILIMMELSYPCKKKVLTRLKWKIIYALTCLVIKASSFFQFMFQIKNLKTRWICCFQMMMINHIMCTLKISTDLCFTKQNKKQKNKKWFCKTCLQCFSGEIVLTKHEEYCLSINGKQSVKLEKGIIEFENYFKQIPVPFKIYADFKCILRVLKTMKVLTQKKISRSCSW